MIVPFSTGKYYLYRHIRLDKNEPFYIGIGTKNKQDFKYGHYHRANQVKGRGEIWNKIVAKTNYEVEILLESNDYKFIKQKEIEFISLYGRKDLRTGILANLTKGGDGGQVSKETGNKIAKKLSKKVVQISLDGKFIKEWSSISKAGKKLGLKPGHISACCKSKLRSIGGYLWFYSNEYDPNKDLSHHTNFGRPIYQYNIHGGLIAQFKNIRHCIDKLGLGESAMYNINVCIQGKAKTAYGYIWASSPKTIKPNYSITRTDVSTGEKEYYTSISSAARHNCSMCTKLQIENKAEKIRRYTISQKVESNQFLWQRV